jgi:glycine/D-amino acid oxidase-like deaminating enzyme
VNQVAYEEKPVIYTSQERVQADLLVLATGVNGNLQLAPEFGYLGPKTKKMVHGEMTRPPDWPVDEVKIYFKAFPGMVFGAMTPKGRYLNISLFGNGLIQKSISQLIGIVDPGADQLSTSNILCGCMPEIAIGPARKYYGSRWVAGIQPMRVYARMVVVSVLFSKIACRPPSIIYFASVSQSVVPILLCSFR